MIFALPRQTAARLPLIDERADSISTIQILLIHVQEFFLTESVLFILRKSVSVLRKTDAPTIARRRIFSIYVFAIVSTSTGVVLKTELASAARSFLALRKQPLVALTFYFRQPILE